MVAEEDRLDCANFHPGKDQRRFSISLYFLIFLFPFLLFFSSAIICISTRQPVSMYHRQTGTMETPGLYSNVVTWHRGAFRPQTFAACFRSMLLSLDAEIGVPMSEDTMTK